MDTGTDTANFTATDMAPQANANLTPHDRTESPYDLLWHDRFDVTERAALLGRDCRRIEQAVHHGERAARTVNHRIVGIDRMAVIAWLGGNVAPQPAPDA